MVFLDYSIMTQLMSSRSGGLPIHFGLQQCIYCLLLLHIVSVRVLLHVSNSSFKTPLWHHGKNDGNISKALSFYLADRKWRKVPIYPRFSHHTEWYRHTRSEVLLRTCARICYWVTDLNFPWEPSRFRKMIDCIHSLYLFPPGLFSTQVSKRVHFAKMKTNRMLYTY